MGTEVTVVLVVLVMWSPHTHVLAVHALFSCGLHVHSRKSKWGSAIGPK